MPGYAADAAIAASDLARFIIYYPYPKLFHSFQKSRRYIHGSIGNRKYTISPFGLERHAELLEKSHCIGRIKGIKSAVKELTITWNILNERGDITVICNISASLACDI